MLLKVKAKMRDVLVIADCSRCKRFCKPSQLKKVPLYGLKGVHVCPTCAAELERKVKR